MTSFFTISGPSRKTHEEENFLGCNVVHVVQEAPRRGKTASICVWTVLSVLIQLVFDKKLFPKWGLIFL